MSSSNYCKGPNIIGKLSQLWCKLLEPPDASPKKRAFSPGASPLRLSDRLALAFPFFHPNPQLTKLLMGIPWAKRACGD